MIITTKIINMQKSKQTDKKDSNNNYADNRFGTDASTRSEKHPGHINQQLSHQLEKKMKKAQEKMHCD